MASRREVFQNLRLASSVYLALLIMTSSVLNARALTPTVSLPTLRRLPTAQAIVLEHIDALNHCDWKRLMAQYPSNVELFLPGGQVIKGRDQVASLFQDIVKPFKDGGVCGVTFHSEHKMLVGNTLSVQWRVTANFLTKPYSGADAYITKDGLMAGQVTTFDREQLK